MAYGTEASILAGAEINLPKELTKFHWQLMIKVFFIITNDGY